MIPITKEQLKQIMPMASMVRINTFLPFLNATMYKYNIDNRLRQSAFIAQLAHESGCFKYVKEIASGDAYTNRTDLGNTLPEAIALATAHNTTTGRMWKGRGLIQITGFNNYRRLSKAIGVDLVSNPYLLEQPNMATQSAGWFWVANGLNYLADKKDFKRITRIINGGYNGYADRVYFYERALQAIK